MECFSFLNRALKSELAPVLVIASNRGLSKIRDTDYISPHGVPLDFLDRLMIILTQPYSVDEIRKILMVRCKEEEVDMEPPAMELLTRIASETSLRYAIHLIITSQLGAKKRKQKEVQLVDIERCYDLFVDVKRSTKLVLQHQKDFLYNELNVEDETMATMPAAEAMEEG
jgi:RuvB-like protein 2